MTRWINHRFCRALIRSSQPKACLALSPSLTGTTTIRRLRNSFESWFDDLDFAQWLFVLCITATALLIRNRLRRMTKRSIRLFFKWVFQHTEREIEK
jgi:hypothetical protein